MNGSPIPPYLLAELDQRRAQGQEWLSGFGQAIVDARLSHGRDHALGIASIALVSLHADSLFALLMLAGERIADSIEADGAVSAADALRRVHQVMADLDPYGCPRVAVEQVAAELGVEL